MTKKPFTKEHVIRETLKHMQRSIAISTQKTLARMPEFQDDSDSVAEVMSALSDLGRLNNLIEDIRINNGIENMDK